MPMWWQNERISDPGRALDLNSLHGEDELLVFKVNTSTQTRHSVQNLSLAVYGSYHNENDGYTKMFWFGRKF